MGTQVCTAWTHAQVTTTDPLTATKWEQAGPPQPHPTAAIPPTAHPDDVQRGTPRLVEVAVGTNAAPPGQHMQGGAAPTMLHCAALRGDPQLRGWDPP
jgi:hypothetical protein